MNDTYDKNIYFLLLNNNKVIESSLLLQLPYSQENRGFGYQNTRQRNHMLELSFTVQKDHHNPYYIQNATDILDQIIPQHPVHCQIHHVSVLTQLY